MKRICSELLQELAGEAFDEAVGQATKGIAATQSHHMGAEPRASTTPFARRGINADVIDESASPTLGELIFEARRLAGLTQGALVSKLGLKDRTTIVDWEKDRVIPQDLK